MKNLKLIVLLITILTIKSTAFTQNFSNDSIKCFTYDQVRKITKSIKQGQLCDSISHNQELQIINFKELSIKNDSIILENNKRLLEVTKTLNTTKLKLKISKRLTFLGVPIALGGGLLLGVILSK